MGLTEPASVNMIFETFSASFALRMYAPLLTSSSLTASYTSLTATIDCSEAQIIPLSNVLDIRIEDTAI